MTPPAVPTPAGSPAVAPLARELGLTGLKRSNGYVLEEYHPRLMGDKALKVYEEMETSSPTVGAALLAIELLVRQVTWRFEGSDPDAEDPRVQFLDECLHDLDQPWTDTLGEILTMLPYGFTYHELVYKRRVAGASKFSDGKIGWRGMPIRAQVTRDKWEFGPSGELQGMWQISPPDYQRVFIPIQKALHVRPGAHKHNPEGRSVLRRAYRPWFFAKRIEEFEGIGIERDLAGLPVVEIPAEMMAESAPADYKATLAHFKQLVVNLRRDEQEGVVMPQQYDQHGNPMYKLSLLSTGARRQFDTTAILQRYHAQIATTMLADFLMLGHEKVGSYALASSKTSLFGVAIGAWLDVIAEAVNTQAVPRLLALNGMPLDDMPRLCHGDIESPDLEAVGRYISALTGAGMPLFPDQKVENQLRGYADLPTLTDEEFAERQEALDAQREAELAAATEAEGAATREAAVAKAADEDRLARLAAALRPGPAHVDVTVDVGAPQTTVTVPKQATKPPVVNVDVAPAAVTVAPSPAPVVQVTPEVQVTVEGARPGAAITVKRDKAGKIQRLERPGGGLVVRRDAAGKIERLERTE